MFDSNSELFRLFVYNNILKNSQTQNHIQYVGTLVFRRLAFVRCICVSSHGFIVLCKLTEIGRLIVALVSVLGNLNFQ